SALWAFASNASSFEQSVLAAARLGGDVDTICAMTGALAGGLLGRKKLADLWVANLNHERPGPSDIEAIALALVRRARE
ncbi:MAG: ADP-ribosylglycohydrolase family protein, partial [Polyangiales bacterium]